MDVGRALFDRGRCLCSISWAQTSWHASNKQKVRVLARRLSEQRANRFVPLGSERASEVTSVELEVFRAIHRVRAKRALLNDDASAQGDKSSLRRLSRAYHLIAPAFSRLLDLHGSSERFINRASIATDQLTGCNYLVPGQVTSRCSFSRSMVGLEQLDLDFKQNRPFMQNSTASKRDCSRLRLQNFPIFQSPLRSCRRPRRPELSWAFRRYFLGQIMPFRLLRPVTFILG